MALWDKLRTELDRAGRVASGAIDEGKLRLEVFRARQHVDRAAQSLGYAVYRSRTGLESPDDTAIARLVDAVREREQELAVLEERMRSVTGRGAGRDDEAAPADHGSPTGESARAGGGSPAADGARADAAPPPP